MYELGTFGVLTDGYISRIPQSAFFGGGGGLAQTQAALSCPTSRPSREC